MKTLSLRGGGGGGGGDTGRWMCGRRGGSKRWSSVESGNGVCRCKQGAAACVWRQSVSSCFRGGVWLLLFSPTLRMSQPTGNVTVSFWSMCAVHLKFQLVMGMFCMILHNLNDGHCSPPFPPPHPPTHTCKKSELFTFYNFWGLQSVL